MFVSAAAAAATAQAVLVVTLAVSAGSPAALSRLRRSPSSSSHWALLRDGGGSSQPAGADRALTQSRDPLQSSIGGRLLLRHRTSRSTLLPRLCLRERQISGGAKKNEAQFYRRATSGRWEKSEMGETSDRSPDSHLQQMSNQSAAPSAGGKVFCQSGGSGEDPPNQRCSRLVAAGIGA